MDHLPTLGEPWPYSIQKHRVNIPYKHGRLHLGVRPSRLNRSSQLIQGLGGGPRRRCHFFAYQTGHAKKYANWIPQKKSLNLWIGYNEFAEVVFCMLAGFFWKKTKEGYVCCWTFRYFSRLLKMMGISSLLVVFQGLELDTRKMQVNQMIWTLKEEEFFCFAVRWFAVDSNPFSVTWMLPSLWFEEI